MEDKGKPTPLSLGEGEAETGDYPENQLFALCLHIDLRLEFLLSA